MKIIFWSISQLSTYPLWHSIASIQDASVFNALNESSKTQEALNKQLDIDKLEEIKERLDDQRADMEERQQFFIDAGKGQEDEDDLLAMLDDLEAEAAEEDLDVEIGAGAIKGSGQAVPSKPQAQKSDEDELKALEMMMAWKVMSVIVAINIDIFPFKMLVFLI